MYQCKHCKGIFPFPEIKRPDAGLVHGFDIIGKLNVAPLRMCPECGSVEIDQVEGTLEQEDEEKWILRK